MARGGGGRRGGAARRRRQLELDLREALRAGQFRLNFQPIFELAADRIGGFEDPFKR